MFKYWLILTEAQEQDQFVLKLLNNNQILFQQIKEISPESKYMPILAYFYNQQPNLAQLRQDGADYKKLVDKKLINLIQITNKGAFLDNKPIDYLRFTEKVHGLMQFQQPLKHVSNE